MGREKLIELWNDMWSEGNWVPSFPDSLAGLTAEEAAWTPDASCHSIWQEVVHVTFWRRVTLNRMAGGAPPGDEEVMKLEFAAPAIANDETWSDALAELKRSQDEIAAALQDPEQDAERILYHLIHDPYHLGRITQLRAMRGTPPKF